MSKKGKRLMKGIFAGARVARMTEEEFISSVCEAQGEENRPEELLTELPDEQAMSRNIISVDLIFWDEDTLTLYPEELEQCLFTGLRIAEFRKREKICRVLTCDSFLLAVNAKADRMYRTMYLTTEPVLQRLGVADVTDVEITYHDGRGNIKKTRIRLPLRAKSGFRVNALEEYKNTPDGGATLTCQRTKEKEE